MAVDWSTECPLISGVLLQATTPAYAQERKVHWEHVIGILQPGEVIGSGTGQVTGSDRIWVARSGHAHVHLASGEFQFKVKGLLLATGNGSSASDLGTTGEVTQVKGTLVCDLDGSAGGGNSVLTDTESAVLSQGGHVERSGHMVVPTVCTTESDNIFLIRIADPASAADQWIAAGIGREERQ